MGKNEPFWCPVVTEWMKGKEIDLNQLREHVDQCPICQRIYKEVYDAMSNALSEIYVEWDEEEE
jgi:hypothetical protein